ncbi:nuclear transport factor 2 family protein [Streptomyces olivaceoviridis]|uniref:nuclear transport factor 2 family protein n=1 Tax=Streptomyces olivaceoviridis TaxID=1921 RepID=UPI003691A00B
MSGTAGARNAITAPGVEGGSWTRAFAAKEEDGFAEAFAADVLLEASVLRRPVRGREKVALVMATASKVYESLVFTHETRDGDRTYLEWEATAFGGTELLGCTILVRDGAGRITRAVIQHRPLTGLLTFSAELGRLLKGRIEDDVFHQLVPDAGR